MDRYNISVPKGSVLGTTLFLVYINDLPESIDGLVKIFTDDTKVCRAINSADTPVFLQNNVGKSDYWVGDGRCYTTQKNNIMFIWVKIQRPVNMKMGSGNNRSTIKRGEAEKDLRVIIDEKFNYYKHITKKLNSANRNLGIIF